MPKWLLRHWYLFSATVALLSVALVLVRHDAMPLTRTLMVLNFAVFNLQFTEKFGWPGGFAGLRDTSAVPAGWPRPAWSEPGRNVWAHGCLAVFVFLPPVLFPDQMWLVMGSVSLGFMAALCHCTVFGTRPGLHYNPGMAMALLGYVPVGLALLCHAYDIGIQITLVDWGAGLLIPLGLYGLVLGIAALLSRRASARHRRAADGVPQPYRWSHQVVSPDSTRPAP